MSLRARLQGGLAGAACSIALWQVTRRDIGAAHERLAQTMQTHRLVLPRPQTTPEQLPPLKLADAPDWRSGRSFSASTREGA